MLALVQVRPCDGACCKAAPRFPVARGVCKYFDDTIDVEVGKAGRFCKLFADTSKQRELSKRPRETNLNKLSDRDYFQQTCVDWPQNSTPKIGDTAGCCWQWVEDGD